MEQLITERLILREWRETDSKDLYEYGKSELVGPNAGWTPHQNEQESQEIIKRFIAEDDTYVIVLKDENKVIGSIGLHDTKPDTSLSELNQREIGYVLNPDYWGRGIIPEAVKCVMKYGFTELNLDILWCAHFDFNHNSKRVIEKCGFQYQFQKDQVLKHYDNKEVTTLFYSINNTDFFNQMQ